jgi:putative transcriptional regulator
MGQGGSVMFTIKAERVKRGIKQVDLAKKVGITPQYLHLIEIGKVEPRRNLIIAMSKELGMSPEKLFFNEEE